MRASLILLLLGVAAGAFAAEPSLEVLPPSGTVTVGQRLVLRVVARGGEGMMWGDLRLAAEPDGPWELVDGPHSLPGSNPPAWEVALAAMKVGDLEVPKPEVSVRSGTGETSQVVLETPVTVTVASVLAGDDQGQPAPLRDPVGARGLPWEWVVPGLAGGLPVAAVVALWLLRRRRGELEEERPTLAPLPELEGLVEALLAGIGRESADVICDRLAGGLRRFLERRSGEPAQEMTSFELRLLGRRRSWPESVQRSLQSVMVVADSVRFGRRDVAEGALRDAVATALATGRGLEAHLAPPVAGEEAAG